jgi:hypothetical protein
MVVILRIPWIQRVAYRLAGTKPTLDISVPNYRRRRVFILLGTNEHLSFVCERDFRRRDSCGTSEQPEDKYKTKLSHYNSVRGIVRGITLNK